MSKARGKGNTHQKTNTKLQAHFSRQKMPFTFDQLPEAVSQLYAKMESIESLLLSNRTQPASTATDQWFDLNELCEYLPDKPAKATAYGWVHLGTIPYHKGGKKLRFLRSEIDSWLKQSRKKTVEELANEADKFLTTTKRKTASHE